MHVAPTTGHATCYAELIPALLSQVSAEAGAPNTQFRRARREYYNVYSIPWRIAEVLDVLRRYSGLDSLDSMRVVDAGCGFGGISLFLATDASASEVIGLDINVESLAALSNVCRDQGISNVRPLCADLTETPLTSDSVDLALLYDSFVYRSMDVSSTLLEYWRVLRPGGRLVIKVANGWSPLYLALAVPGVRLLAGRTLNRLADSADRSFHAQNMRIPSARMMTNLIARTGFVDIRLCDRYRRSDRGLVRYVLPQVILIATKPRVDHGSSPSRVTSSRAI